ncbi:7074_t:CDS:1, partial [Cetraspora pellucida]
KPKGSLQKLLYVVQESELLTVLYELYSNILANHFSIDETYNYVKNKYYWPKIYKSIANYIQTCNTCQQQEGTKQNEFLYILSVSTSFH